MNEALFNFDEKRLDYYQILGVEKDAGDEEIKRAYFTQVRKFQPGSAPEKFKEIRTAYETLKDKQKRNEYDAIGDIPPSMTPLFNEARWFDHLGRHSRAGEFYRTILKAHPELDNVREQYAASLGMDQKPGKAAEVWEELCKRNPSNAIYSKELAHSYLDRGWHKKAETELRRAIGLDPSSVDAWSLIVSCVVERIHSAPDRDTVIDELGAIVDKAIAAIAGVKGNEVGKIHLYSYAIISSSDKDKSVVAGYFEEITRLVRDGGEGVQQNALNALEMIFRSIPNSRLVFFYNEIKKIAALLPELSAAHLHYSSRMVHHPLLAQFESIQTYSEIENLPKKGFSEILCDLFKLLNGDIELDDGEDEIEIAAMEFEILDKKGIYDPQIRRLKTEFPELYALHSSFFNEALRTKDPEKMIYQRSKKIRKYQRESGSFDDNPESAPELPVRRTAPKVGRNDPCPCGSGKKYKKCCGA
ncbi:hypothetical protein AGMMS49928_17500 [Spirochaetia bacterium]|nr:hypothetical protein AGMMS49928_17500 [Spirochaetia bacterium]